MKSFSALEDQNVPNSKNQIIFFLYLGVIGVISHYAFPSESIVEARHSKPVNLHDSLRSPNYMVEGDSFIPDDEIANDSDARKTSFPCINFIASQITSSNPGSNRGKLKSPVNSFLYDSTSGYSHLRSPPSFKLG